MTQNIWLIDDDRTALKPITDLLIRDWRTRVMQTTHDYRTSMHFAKRSAAKYVTHIVMDLDTPDDGRWLRDLARELKRVYPNKPLIGTCISATDAVMNMVLEYKFDGLLCKDDVEYAYAAVLCQYEQGVWLSTSQVWDKLPKRAHTLGVDQVRVAYYEFGAAWDITQNMQIVRMATCANQNYDDIADELKLTEDIVRRAITNMYAELRLQPEKIDWNELATYIPQHELIAKLQAKYEEKPRSAKSKLAFYLLTAPTHIANYKLH